MVTLKLSVHGQHIKLKGDLPRCTVSDTVNYFRCEFTFDETWSDFNDISVYFKNMSSGIVKSCRLAADGTCYIPWEVLQNTGVVVANAIGILMNGDTVVRKLPTFPVELFVQVEEGQTQVSPSEDPTPTRYEQFIGEVHGAVDDAKSFADAARLSYYKIRDMKASAFGIPYDVPPAVTVVEGGQGGSFELVFAIPKGEPGEAGEDGRGIVSIDKTGTEDLVDTYTITYSDGTTSTYQVTNGSAGIVRWSDIADKPDFDTLFNSKVDKVSGKGLSSNDYTSSDKEVVTTLSDRASTDGYTYVFRRNNTGKGIWGIIWSDDVMYDRDVTVDDVLRNKVDKVTGKGLSTNDFTTALKNKLDGIASGAEVNVQADWNQTNVNADDYIKNKPTIPEGVKLYSATGQSTDGAMTQKATTDAFNSKVDKVSGKGLSSNDYTTDHRNLVTKLSNRDDVGSYTHVFQRRGTNQGDWDYLTTTDIFVEQGVTLDDELYSKVDSVRSDRNSVKFANGHYTSYLELFNVPNHGSVAILKAEEEVSTRQTNMAGLTAETDGDVSKATLYANSYDEARDGARIELYETYVDGGRSSVDVRSDSFYHNGSVVLTRKDLGMYHAKAGGTDYTTDLSSGTDTVKNIASISLPPGVWCISAMCRFTPTSSGAHVTSVGLTTTSAGDYPQDRRYGSSTYFNQHNLVNIIDLRNNTGGTTIYLTGKSSVAGSWNRGSNTALSLRAVKVPAVYA